MWAYSNDDALHLCIPLQCPKLFDVRRLLSSTTASALHDIHRHRRYTQLATLPYGDVGVKWY